jgi:hypothetical protein
MQTHWQFYSSGAVKIAALPRDAIQITEAAMKTTACLPCPTAMYFASEHIVLHILRQDKETVRASF